VIFAQQNAQNEKKYRPKVPDAASPTAVIAGLDPAIHEAALQTQIT
jgi:hypothetical protein